MARFLFIAALSIFSAELTGAAAIVGAEACREGCPDDDADGQCGLECHDCICCAQVHVDAPRGRAVVIARRTGQRLVAPPTMLPSSPDPREILHIPKLLLA